MNIFRIILSLLMISFGLWIVITNWLVVLKWIVKKESHSWIPVIGGLSLAIAFIILPNNSFWYLFGIAFLLDWGCIPGFLHQIFLSFLDKYK